MSYIPFNAEDFVVSADSITSTLWSNNASTLTSFFTASATITNNAYLPVYAVSPISNTTALPQFSLAYGQVNGTGSAPINASVTGSSPTRITYGQFRDLVMLFKLFFISNHCLNFLQSFLGILIPSKPHPSVFVHKSFQHTLGLG